MKWAHLANPGAVRRVSYAGTSARSQRGMTTLGLIFLVGFVGVFVFAIMRLTPIYLNYLKVAGVVNGVFDEFDSQNPTRGAIRLSISRRFGVESVDVLHYKDVKVQAVDGGFEVQAKYDHTSPFIANVYFTVKFDKTVIVRR
jgi:hypothetical protein